MKYDNLGGFSSINAYVEAKLKKFSAMEKNYRSLFELMFSERENVMIEKTDGYRIKKTTYGECRGRILRRAATLNKMLGGLKKGSAVGVYLNNGAEFIEILWSVLLCGFDPLLLNMRLDCETLNGALKEAGAVAVISGKKKFPVTTILERDITEAEEEFTAGEFGGEILVMSSGTSLSVKICAYSAEELYYHIGDSFDIIKRCRISKTHYKGQLKLLAFLPFYHIFGLVAVYLWFAFFSRTFVLLSDMDPQTIVNTIRKHEVTHIFAVPLFWETVYSKAMKQIKDRGEKTYKKFLKGLKISNALPAGLSGAFARSAFGEVRDNLFGESVRFCITGGSGISREVMEFFNGIGYHLTDGYGMTEIGITSVELSMNKKILNSRSVGKPMSSIEYRIGEGGRLFVRGKAVAKYVLEGGKTTSFKSEWFDTKDIAEEKNGRFYILGREDDLVISPTGENLNPNIIEPQITISGTAGVCLIGDDRGQSHVPVLIISVNKYLGAERLEEIIAEAKAKLSSLNLSSQISKIVMIAQPLMEGEEFKINRKRIKRDYSAGKFTIVTPENTIKYDGENGERAKIVKEFFAKALGKDVKDVGYASDFFTDEGGTSLDYFAMMGMIQQKFGVSFPSAGSRSLNSVKDVCEYIEENS